MPSDNSGRLLTWVDVEQRIRSQRDAGQWPPGLHKTDVYWTGLRLRAEQAHEAAIRSWLRDLFGSRLREDADLLVLDSPHYEAELPIEFEFIDKPTTEPQVGRASFDRPLQISRARAAPVYESEEVESHQPPLIAFHSYKGGVGRTTHAIAFALAAVNASGGPVLLVDGDFEAPGLSWHLRTRYPIPEVSYADLLVLAHGEQDPTAGGATDSVATLLKNQMSHGLYVLPSFRDSFRWETLDIRPSQLANRKSPFAVSDLLTQLGRKLNVTAVVVDLRAGLSELSAGLLLDPRASRILVTSIGEQSVLGTVNVAENLRLRMSKAATGTTHFVVSHVPSDLLESEKLADITEKLTAAFAGDDAKEDIDIPELVVTEYEPRLVTLPLEWDQAMQVLDTVALPRRLQALIDRLPIGSDCVEDASAALSIEDARRQLVQVSERQIFAEQGEATGFLRIEPLKHVAADNRTRLPKVVMTGAKGAGKTYTFLQLVRARSWERFVSQVLGEPEAAPQERAAHVVPLLEPRNLDDNTRGVLAELESQRANAFGVESLSTHDVRADAARHIDGETQSETRWTEFWLTAMARRVGLEVGSSTSGAALIDGLKRMGQRVVFVVDGLEDLFQDFRSDEVQRMGLRALLQSVPEALGPTRAQIGLLVLIRPDLVRAAITQNAQQFLYNYRNYQLRWTHDSALKLAVWLALRAGALEGELDDVANLSEARLDALLEQLWGKKLGTPRSREASSKPWVLGVLSDFHGGIQARDVVRLVHHAAQRSLASDDSRFTDRILVPTAMRLALEDWGKEKVRELAEEDKRLEQIFETLDKVPGHNKRVPFGASDVGLEQDETDDLRDRGIIYDDKGKLYLAELVRIGLGFEVGTGARSRIVSLRRKALKGS